VKIKKKSISKIFSTAVHLFSDKPLISLHVEKVNIGGSPYANVICRIEAYPLPDDVTIAVSGLAPFQGPVTRTVIFVSRHVVRPRVDAMITIFCDFTIFCKNGVFLKNRCYDQNFAKFSFVLSQKTTIFLTNFSAKIFKKS
jgi:hypothetical protein